MGGKNTARIQDYSKGRYLSIDIARGLCLVWMTIAHVVSTSGVPETYWLRLCYPEGWSTTIFVMLTGLSLGLLAQRAKAKGAPKRYWYRRATQIFVMAYLSNVVMTAFMAYADTDELSLARLLAILLLREPWTISAILLPTGALLVFAGLLETTVEKLRAPVFFTVVSVFAWWLWEWVGAATLTGETSTALFHFDNPRFSFPLGLLFLLGVWAFAFASLWPAKRHRWTGLGGLVLCLFYPFTDYSAFYLYLFRFGATLSLAWLFEWLPSYFLFSDFLRLLGRSSLLVFITHQVLIEGEVLALYRFDPAVKAPVMFFSVLTICAFACLAKERNPRLGKALKRIGF